jgi:cytochrome c551/c552
MFIFCLLGLISSTLSFGQSVHDQKLLGKVKSSLDHFSSINNEQVCTTEKGATTKASKCPAANKNMPTFTTPPSSILGIRPYSARAIEFAKHYQEMSEQLHNYLGEPRVITSLAFESHVVNDVSKNLKNLEDSIALAEQLKATKTGDIKAVGKFIKDLPGVLTSKESAMATYRYGLKPFIDLPIEKWGWHNLDQIIMELKELHENMAAMNMHIFSYMTSPQVSPLVVFFKQIAKCDPKFNGYMNFPNDKNGVLREAFHKLYLLSESKEVEERKKHSYDFSILLIAHEQMYAQTYYDRISKQHEKLAGLFKVNDPVGQYQLIDKSWADFNVRFSLNIEKSPENLTASDILKTTRKPGTITGYYESRIFAKNALSLLVSPKFPIVPEGPKPAAVDENRGMKLLTQYGCVGCHSTSGATTTSTVGPNLGKVGSYLNKEKIKQAILNPNAEISNHCSGKQCASNIMPQNYKDIIKPEEIDFLVQYISELK